MGIGELHLNPRKFHFSATIDVIGVGGGGHVTAI